MFPSGVQDGSHGTIDLFATPKNGVVAESHVTDSGFDSKPTASVENGFKADFKATSGSTTNELSSNSLRGSVDTDDAFGDFEAAFMDEPSKKKVTVLSLILISLTLFLFLKNMQCKCLASR